MNNVNKLLEKKWLLILAYFIIGAVTLLSIYVFIAGGNFISILDTIY